jgi:hypothetical protein
MRQENNHALVQALRDASALHCPTRVVAVSNASDADITVRWHVDRHSLERRGIRLAARQPGCKTKHA